MEARFGSTLLLVFLAIGAVFLVTRYVPFRPWLRAKAADGVPMKAFARLSVRLKLDRLVGGVSAETLLDRVHERIAETVAEPDSADLVDHADVIGAGPGAAGFDADAVFEIVTDEFVARAAEPAA